MSRKETHVHDNHKRYAGCDERTCNPSARMLGAYITLAHFSTEASSLRHLAQTRDWHLSAMRAEDAERRFKRLKRDPTSAESARYRNSLRPISNECAYEPRPKSPAKQGFLYSGGRI